MIREIILLEDEQGQDDDEDEDDDEEDEEEEGEGDEEDLVDSEDEKDVPLKKTDDGSSGNSSSIRLAKARLVVPDEGYNEDEDCVDVEDEEYRAMLDKHEKMEGIRKQKFINGEEIDDEDEDEEDDDFVTPIDNLDVGQYLCNSLITLSQREPALGKMLRDGLADEDKVRLEALISAKLNRN